MILIQTPRGFRNERVKRSEMSERRNTGAGGKKAETKYFSNKIAEKAKKKWE